MPDDSAGRKKSLEKGLLKMKTELDKVNGSKSRDTNSNEGHEYSNQLGNDYVVQNGKCKSESSVHILSHDTGFKFQSMNYMLYVNQILWIYMTHIIVEMIWSYQMWNHMIKIDQYESMP